MQHYLMSLMSLWVSRLPAEHRNTAWITAHLVPTEMFSFFFPSFSPMQMKGKWNFQSQNKVAHWGINLTELSWVIRSVIGSDSAIISLTVCLNKHIKTLASVSGAGIPPGDVCSDVICANVELILLIFQIERHNKNFVVITRQFNSDVE